ncbi:MAG: ABC transporter permease [Proteobacteria bacterium]|nr:ABC transporter permease [Pseudomonadota bacterium]
MTYTARVGIAVLVAVVAVGLTSPLGAWQAALEVSPDIAGQGPSPAHWLGTDHLGRDVFARLQLAAGAFAGPGLLACAVALVLAVPLAAVTAYRGGVVGSATRFGFTSLAAIPRFVLVLLVLSIYGDSSVTLALVAGVSYVPMLGEAVFERIERLRGEEYVLASQAHGLSGARILWVHLVWAACGRLIGRHLLALFGFYLVLETTLSYIGGFGVQEPTPSWGNMLVFEWGRRSVFDPALLAPGLALWLTLAATGWAAEALGEVEHG